MINTWKNTAVCLVNGYRYDTRLETGEQYETITLGEVFSMADQPDRADDKGRAPAVILSTYCEYDARDHAAQQARGSYAALWADIDEGNHSLPDVVSAVKQVAASDHAWFIYSTYSAAEEAPRWRVIIPLQQALPFDRWQIAQKALATRLAEEGLVIDLCGGRSGQLSILPVHRPFYQTESNASAEALDVDADWLFLAHCYQAEERQAKVETTLKEAAEGARKARSERQTGARHVGAKSPIDCFNEQYSIAALLSEYGYKQKRPNSADWRSPYQTSGSYATRDYGDYWVSLSGSDAAKRIGRSCSGGQFGDAFDLYVHFEHNGDFTAAVRTVDAEMPPCSAAEFDYLTTLDKETSEPSAKSGFHFTPVWQLEYRPPEFLVDELIETESLGLIFGDPGCGKSFVAVDLAMSVATGIAFHGRDVKQGSVFFIAGEGHNGLTRRMTAWAKSKGIGSMQDVQLFKSNRAAQFLDARSALEVKHAVAGLAKSYGAPALIVIDTLARNFGSGDENSTKDMSDFVASVDDIKAHFPNCTILIVHHTGHAEKQRARGAMALKGALDCEYRLEKANSVITMTNTKMKDAEPPSSMSFQLQSIELDDGASSAVLAPTSAPRKVKALTANQKLAIDCFIDAVKETGSFGSDGRVRLHLDQWRETFYTRHTGDNADTKRKAFNRVRGELVAKGEISVENDVYTMLSPAAGVLVQGVQKQVPEEYEILGFDPNQPPARRF
jgi:hypothetical protein